jgi:hypothetical protein
MQHAGYGIILAQLCQPAGQPLQRSLAGDSVDGLSQAANVLGGDAGHGDAAVTGHADAALGHDRHPDLAHIH